MSRPPKGKGGEKLVKKFNISFSRKVTAMVLPVCKVWKRGVSKGAQLATHLNPWQTVVYLCTRGQPLRPSELNARTKYCIKAVNLCKREMNSISAHSSVFRHCAHSCFFVNTDKKYQSFRNFCHWEIYFFRGKTLAMGRKIMSFMRPSAFFRPKKSQKRPSGQNNLATAKKVYCPSSW